MNCINSFGEVTNACIECIDSCGDTFFTDEAHGECPMMKMTCEADKDIKPLNDTCIDLEGNETSECMLCIDSCGDSFFAFDIGFGECPMKKMACE